MWKRWSFKSLSAKDASPSDDKSPQSPSAGIEHVLSPMDSSVKPQTVVNDGTDHIPSLAATQTAASSFQPADENRVASDTTTDLAAAEVLNSSTKVEALPTLHNDTFKPSTKPAGGSLQEDSSIPHRASSSADDSAKIHATEETVLVATKVVPLADEVSNDAISSVKSHGADDHPTPNKLPVPQQEQQPFPSRRLSFRSLAFFYGRDKQPLPNSPSSHSLKATPAEPVRTKPRFPVKPKLSRSEKRALSSALVLRTLIIGPSSPPPSSADNVSKVKHTRNKLVHPYSSPDLKKAKSNLLKAKTANAVIAQLRRLPLPDGPTIRASGSMSSESLVTHPDAGDTPIHAVCLACTDKEADQVYFSRLSASHSAASLPPPPPNNASSATTPSRVLSVGTASLESLVSVLKDLRPVSLLASPDLGFGQPVSEGNTGLLTGSVPSAGAIVNGFEEVTRQLMSLGFATSKAVFPSHDGIYPPEDRMSVLTYWWGLELVLPEPSVQYLGEVESISHTVLNFLSAISLVNNGIREVLPFIRYISTFVDFEWGAIQAQDQGKGVVCAATWVMPAAMVPRPWDFPPRPAPKPDPNAPITAATPAPLKSAPILAPAPDNDPSGDKASVRPTPDKSHPALPPISPHPPAPAAMALPTLKVTPATLPRGVQPPQAASA